MAGQSDGTIIIDTELNSEGFKAGSAELQGAVKSLSGEINNLGPTLHKALSGSESAITSFNSKTATLENTIAEIESKMATLGNATFETADYQNLCAEIDAVTQKLDQLTAKRDKMLQLGVNENSNSYQSLIYDLTELEGKYLRLTALKAQMETSGAAFQSGSQTAEYQQLNVALAEAKSRLAALQSEAAKSNHALGSMASKLASGLRSAVSSMAKLISNSRKLKNSFSSVMTSVKRIAPALLAAEGILGMLRKAVNAYMSANETLANTLSNCWSGIGNLLGPIIERLVNMIATAVAYFTAFLSLLGFVGKGTSKAISGAGGSAKKETDKLKRQLAAFDELNILQNKDEDDSGGGGGAVEPETPGVTLPDWAQLIAEHLKAGKWSEAAAVLTDQLNNMVDSVDWAGVGDKMAYWTDAALEFLATAILTFDWYNLGAKLGEMVNNLIAGVDWGNLGVVLGAKLIILFEGLGGLFAKIKWVDLGTALSECFMGLWNAIDWAQAGRTISDGVIGIINMLSAAIIAIDWQKLSNDVVTCIGAINWSGVLSALATGIGAALGGLAGLLWDPVKDALTSLSEKFATNMERCGGDAVAGLLLGILEAIADIAVWIYDNIFAPFIDGFKSAFGINSPSTVMAEQGKFIILGLLEGITNAWTDITQFFSTALSTLQNTLSNAWNSIKSAGSTAWNSIKENITSIVSAISSTVSSKWSNLTSTISSKVDSIKSTISSGFENVRSTMVDRLSSAMETIKSQGWYSVGSNICSGIADGINAGWSWLKNTVSNLARNLLNAAKSALGIHSPSRLFRDAVGLNIGYGIGEGIEGAEGSIISTVSGVADAIAGEFNANSYSIGNIGMNVDGNIVRGLDNFSNKIADSFSGLMDRLEAVANSVSFSTPRVALGATVPYTVQAEYASKLHSNGMAEGNVQAIVDAITAELIPAVLAGLEAVVSEQRETRQMIGEIEIGDTVIGEAANRYNRKMAVVNGGR